MVKRPCTYSLDYPVVGPMTVFNAAEMVNRNRSLAEDHMTLAHMGATVRLSVTPVIKEVDYLATGMAPRLIHQAHVLAEKKPRQ